MPEQEDTHEHEGPLHPEAGAALEKKPETDEEKSARRAKDLDNLVKGHMENIDGIHKMHPLPFHLPFERLTDAQRKTWAERRKQIDMANKAYHRAVSAACQKHRDEDAAVKKGAA